MSPRRCLLQMHSITKTFPGVKALDNVDFELDQGEVHAIVGANGAGKSTLIKILAGHYNDYLGTIKINGLSLRPLNPRIPLKKGISAISQEINLVENLSISDNIFLGQELLSSKGIGLLDKKRMEKESKSLLEKFGIDYDPNIFINSLTILEKRIVEIIKALHRRAKILILDEPTAELPQKEIKILFQIIQELISNDISVIYISHRIEEIFEISDRVTVLRDGKKVFSNLTEHTNQHEIVAYMLGEELTSSTIVARLEKHTPLLSIRRLNTNFLYDISFEVGAGETIGLVNIPGNGSSQLLEALYGKSRVTSGYVFLDDKLLTLGNPRITISNGIGYLSDDRFAEGLFQNLSLRTNIVIPYIKKLSLFGFIRSNSIIELTSQIISQLGIKINNFDPSIMELSGGNQQKVILARWLCNKAIRLLLMEEPTKGVDIGSKSEIYTIIRQANKNGKSCIISSTDLDELLQLSHRIVIMKNGRVSTVINNENLTRADLIKISIGEERVN